MELSWNLSLLLFFTGLSLEVAAIFLLFNAMRAPVHLARSAIGLILIAISLQVIALFIPQQQVSSYWFVLGASPLLLPALILAWTKRSMTAAADTRSPAASVATVDLTQGTFDEQLRKIQEVLTAHPQGLTLVEIGERLGVEWRRLTGAVKELLERGAIHKEGKRYFIHTDRRG